MGFFQAATLSRRDSMNPTSDLPYRFPIGTRYIIEGHGGRVVARFLEFPDGRRLNLMAAGSLRRKERRTVGARRARGARPRA
jgi:hypothetical protein